MEGCWWILYPG